MSSDLLCTIDQRVATVTLNRPDALNALDVSLRKALLVTFDELARDAQVRVVILTGAGKAFCSGADLKNAAASLDKSVRRTARTLLHDLQPLIECITRMDKPVIAAVNGAAVGFGMSLALACDLLVMSDTAYLFSPFVNIGLVPDGGAAWLVTRSVGYARAFELFIDAQKLSAARCLELGLVNKVVSADALMSSVGAWAASLVQRAPIAVALTKRIARVSQSTGLSETMNLEAELQTLCTMTEDTHEAITAFVEKRTPSFKGQ